MLFSKPKRLNYNLLFKKITYSRKPCVGMEKKNIDTLFSWKFSGLALDGCFRYSDFTTTGVTI
jgi:hypothetical protein